MKNRLLIYFLLVCSFQTIAQNIVPNGDFEQFSGCPSNISCLDSTLFWKNPQASTPDYFHVCASPLLAGVPINLILLGGSFQLPHSGNAYGGIILYDESEPDYREYMETPLTNSLLPNVTYHLEMYVSLINFCNYTSNSIQCYFSDTLIQGIPDIHNLPFTPQLQNMTTSYPDSANWLLLSGNYIAQGGENYLIIGNYKTDNNTSIVPTGLINWPYVHVYVDDVTLTPMTSINNLDPQTNIQLFPNPAIDFINISAKSNIRAEMISIYDVNGSLLIEQDLSKNPQLKISELKQAMYFYEVRDVNGLKLFGKFVKQ